MAPLNKAAQLMLLSARSCLKRCAEKSLALMDGPGFFKYMLSYRSRGSGEELLGENKRSSSKRAECM